MRRLGVSCAILLLLVAGCALPGGERNPFWTVTEMFGVGAGDESGDAEGGGAAAESEAGFRYPLTLTFTNNHPTMQVDTSFAAWVNVNSIRSAEQQDALLSGGYVQLTSTVELGTAFTLVPGTFVYNGPGLAGATSVGLACPLTETSGRGLSQEFSLITPDVLLVFSQPPVSCDNVAFVFGSILIGAGTGPSTSEGGYKTFAQVNVYECEPLRPGLFFSGAGGGRKPNEFSEGDNVLFEFNETADAEGNFGIVTISD